MDNNRMNAHDYKQCTVIDTKSGENNLDKTNDIMMCELGVHCLQFNACNVIFSNVCTVCGEMVTSI